MALAKEIEKEFDHVAQDTAPAKSEGVQLVVETIKSAERFAELAESWLALERETTETFSYFQTFDWCYSWWQNIGRENADAQLRIFVLKDGSRTLAVWPMQLTKLSGGTTALVPLTYPHAEYSNLIAAPSLSDLEILGFVGSALNETECDLVSLAKIPSGTALERATGQMGITAPIEEIASVFEFTEFENKDDYLNSLSTSTRRSRKKRRNKLAKLGEIDFRVIDATDAEFGAMISEALKWKFEWLEETGRNDEKLKVAGLQATLSALSADANAKALAHVMKVDGKPVAIEIGFLQRGHYYAYIGAFDWAMRDYSIGKVQMEQSLLWAIENGVEKYDLLAEPAGYKDSWSNCLVTLQNRTIARSLKGRLYGIVWQHHVRPRVKSFFNNLPKDWRNKALDLKKRLGGK
jgi:CelD/BcsL family acetyltransferase involved in cellulose biosynthesis